MGLGSFPIDLILFGMIALFLVLRLRSVLGRRTGFERPAEPVVAPPGSPVIEGRAEPVPEVPAPRRTLPDPASPAGQALAAMRGIDHGFDPISFLEGAERAFRLIVTAYAAGDRATLAGLLGRETVQAFEAAIATREAAGEVQQSEIRAILETAITEATLASTRAAITVRIVSDQIAFTRDAKGAVVQGTEAVTEIIDLWTFERDLASADPAWRLVAVGQS